MMQYFSSCISFLKSKMFNFLTKAQLSFKVADQHNIFKYYSSSMKLQENT